MKEFSALADIPEPSLTISVVVVNKNHVCFGNFNFDFDFSSGRFDTRLSTVIFRWCYNDSIL
jgi:hypothetical protein